MRRILAIVIVICLFFSLAGCGGSKTSDVRSDGKTAVDQNGKKADSSGESQEAAVLTDTSEDNGEAAAKTDDSIAWDPEKMGGMPQPEGTTIFMEMDLSKTLGQEFAYSYFVTGLTKEVFQEYIKLASEKFPKVMENELTETEGSFLATTEDLGSEFMVRYLEGNLSTIQYMK